MPAGPGTSEIEDSGPVPSALELTVVDPTTVGPGGSGQDGPHDTGEVAARPSRFRLPDMSRRGFLRTGSIGVLAAGVVGSVPGLSSLLTSAESDAPEVGGSGAAVVQTGTAAVQSGSAVAEGDASGVAQSFSARVSNLSTGEIKLFVGNQTLQIQDSDLAQRLSQAARTAQAAGR